MTLAKENPCTSQQPPANSAASWASNFSKGRIEHSTLAPWRYACIEKGTKLGELYIYVEHSPWRMIHGRNS